MQNKPNFNQRYTKDDMHDTRLFIQNEANLESNVNMFNPPHGSRVMQNEPNCRETRVSAVITNTYKNLRVLFGPSWFGIFNCPFLLVM